MKHPLLQFCFYLLSFAIDIVLNRLIILFFSCYFSPHFSKSLFPTSYPYIINIESQGYIYQAKYITMNISKYLLRILPQGVWILSVPPLSVLWAERNLIYPGKMFAWYYLFVSRIFSCVSRFIHFFVSIITKLPTWNFVSFE